MESVKTGPKLLNSSSNDSAGDDIKLKLRPVLGLHHGVGIICGLMIGSGIYIAPQGIMSQARAPGLALVIWVVATVFGFLGAMSYAELGTTFPMFGEKYAYLSMMYSPFVGFQYLWLFATIVRPGANAIKCLTFAKYIFQPLFPGCNVPSEAVFLAALSLTGLMTFLNCLNVKWAARSQNALSAIGVATLLTISIVGVVWIGKGNTQHFHSLFDGATTDVGDIVLALYSALYAVSGWQALNFMTEELKDPHKTLPRAIALSILIVGSFFLLVNVSYIAVLGPQGVAESEAVAVTFARATLPFGTWIISVLIAICNVGSANSGVMITSRLFFAGARNKHLPEMLTFLSIYTTSPVVIMVFQGILSAVFCYFDVFAILNNIVFALTLCDCLCITGMVYYRWKKPHLPRPIKVPIFCPILYMILCWMLVVVTALSRPTAGVIGFVLSVTSGTLFYAIYNAVLKWRPAVLIKISNQLTIITQKILLCAPPDKECDKSKSQLLRVSYRLRQR